MINNKINNIYNKIHKKLDIKILINAILFLLVMGLIFFFSSQPASKSAQVSGFLTRYVLRVFERVFNQDASRDVKAVFSVFDHYVRKFGHFTEYFILGLLAAKLFFSLLKGRSRLMRVLISVSLCFLNAVSDELHQMFVPGRGPGVGDVLLDTVSAAAAVGLILIIYRKAELRPVKKFV